ncbi:MAG: hypothetical protein MR423_00355 [Firmicutes bacterium]|nr:hypothetical protein [Bacillota bacterium]MDY3658870.1 hypothetical protein [Eubacteriales bacterium]
MYKNGKPVENKKSKIDPNTFLPIEEKKEVGVKSDRRKIGKEKLTKQEQRELDF